MNDNFHTLKGYAMQEHKQVTYAMEDYLEMVCRLAAEKDYVRVHELAERLHVKPSSVSKMVQNLKRLGMVEFEKYGYLKPTGQGLELGTYLIYRHRVLAEFLCFVNGTADETEQVEKIEHFFNRETVQNIEKWCKRCKKERL